MARIRRQGVSEHDVSDDSFCHVENGKCSESVDTPRTSPRKKVTKSYYDSASSDSEEPQRREKPPAIVSGTSTKKTRQVRLMNLNKVDLSTSKFKDIPPLRELDYSSKTKPSRPPRFNQQNSSTRNGHLSDSSAEIEVEESVWCGSDRSLDDSDEELPSPRKFIRLPRKAVNQVESTAVKISNENEASTPPRDEGQFYESRAAKKAEPISSRPQSSSDKENAAAFLQFSPPRLYSPSKAQQRDRPVTPPQSPSKSRLQSPSKTKTRIPSPQFRQSLDAFWDVDRVNDWNDQYSPQKGLDSPKKLKFLKDDALASPTSSPRKPKTPSKTTRAERDLKKDFESRKHAIAEKFLAELDEVVTSGKIRELAASTGGVHFIWSKTLSSTAGRANWRKETTKTRNPDGTVESTHKHHASIELAEKVIDDENRLLNVIAHEFCHLANFMISGIKDKPHGAQFKEWGRQCTLAFKHRGVEVTTKHSYQIEYKYIWQCSNEACAVEFKRHSKSIDPKRHTCGTCRGRLVQIKPVPRKDAGNATGYAAFVKANFADVKRGMPRASQKEVMEAVGRKYRAEKSAKENVKTDYETTGKGSLVDVNDIARELEIITIDDD